MLFFFFFKQKTAYEMRISDWSSDVCSSDLLTSDHPVFGGLSSMVFAPDGGLLALSDSGELFGFDPQEKDGGQHEFVAPLPLRAAERNLPKWKWDSESLVSDPASGRYRSEEHTSELQSLMRISYAVFCLKKKKTQSNN